MKCPTCAEDIQDEATKCRFCGQALTKAVCQGWPEFYRNSAGVGYLDPGMLLMDYEEHLGLSLDGCLSAGDPIGCLIDNGSSDPAADRAAANRIKDAISHRLELIQDETEEAIVLRSLYVYLCKFLSFLHEEKGELWADDPRNLEATASSLYVFADKFASLDPKSSSALKAFLDNGAESLRERADRLSVSVPAPVREEIAPQAMGASRSGCAIVIMAVGSIIAWQLI